MHLIIALSWRKKKKLCDTSVSVIVPSTIMQTPGTVLQAEITCIIKERYMFTKYILRHICQKKLAS